LDFTVRDVVVAIAFPWVFWICKLAFGILF
jgi:hypothetical protein